MLFFLAAIAVLLIAGFIYQQVGEARDARRFPPRGRLVEVNGSRYHVHESGSGEPAVVLESGIAASSLSWSLVQPEIAKLTRVVSYDRAGLGWSDPPRRKRTAAAMLEELRAVLRAADVVPPYVLVGHSFGGLIALLHAQRYPEELSGLVLVDPVWRGEWSPLGREQRRTLRGAAFLARWGALLARFGFVRLNLALLAGGGRRVPQLAARMTAGPGASMVDRLVGQVRKLPAEVWPMISAHWCNPKSFESMADHLDALAASIGEFRRDTTLGDLPMIVISGAHLGDAAQREHEQDARLSTRGRRVIAPGGGHWVQLDEPDIVVYAIREIVEAARRNLSPEHRA